MAIDADDIDDKIEELIDEPKSLTADGMSKTNLSPADLVELDRHVARKGASKWGFGIRPMQAPEH